MSTADDAIDVSKDSDDEDTPAQQQHMQGPNSQRATSETAARCVVDLTMDSDDEPTARRDGDAEPTAPRAPPPRPAQRLNSAPPPRARQAPKPQAPPKKRARDASQPKRPQKKPQTKRMRGGRSAFASNSELIEAAIKWDYRRKAQHDIALPSTPPPPEPDLRGLPTDPVAVAASLKRYGLPNATLSWTNDAEALVLLRSVLRAEGFRAWRVAVQVAAGRRHRFLKPERAIDTECAWCLQKPARHGPSGTCSDGCFHALALSTESSSGTSVYMRQCVLARAAGPSGIVRCECGRCRKELYRPGCGTFYCEVDHRRRVDRGGGCCGLENLRPMNPQCHRDKEHPRWG